MAHDQLVCVCVPVHIARSLGIEIFAHIVEPAGPSRRRTRTRTRTTTTITITRASVAFTCLHVVFFSLASPLHFFFGSFPAFRCFRFTNYWKNTIFRDFLIFLRSWIFFLFFLYFSSLILPISAFHLSIFSEIFDF